MIVLYLKPNNQFLQAIKGFPEVKEEGGRLLFMDGTVIINDLTKAGYKEYPDQGIEVPKEWNKEAGMELDLPVTLGELNLSEEYTAENLKAKRDLFAEVDELRAELKTNGVIQ